MTEKGESLSAIELAFGLARMPTMTRHLRSLPLPSGLSLVLGVAAGIERDIEEVSLRFVCTRTEAQAIARLYLQQAILFPGADSYRILCVRPGSPWEELVQNRRLLMRWLHPDANRNRWETDLFVRVSDAWEELKARHATEGRVTLPSQGNGISHHLPHVGRHIRWIPHTVGDPPPVRRQGRLLGLAALGAIFLWAVLWNLWGMGDVRRTLFPTARSHAVGEAAADPRETSDEGVSSLSP